ncbi:IclR family transcriptional regulator C-terminal domain-containing protein [Psychromonas sp. KJ10-10]|uniref:IclR family transcriptional regulator domain-containing protein n=1 Tax=Psychromonas sp. KJ10-10 TaxID=3391823 RepID=UPI0039B3AFA8
MVKYYYQKRDETFIRNAFIDVEFKKSTDNTLENIEQLLEELKKVKAQHYGEDNEEQEPGLRCIATPVYDRFGTIIAGISISFPTIRFDEESMSHYVDLLHQAGRKISEELGYKKYPIKE